MDAVEANRTIEPRQPHFELYDPGTHDIWLTSLPVSRADYDALEPPAPLVKSGFGAGCMDEAWFRRSPGAGADGPCDEMMVGSIVLLRVARPRLAEETRIGVDGPRRLPVDKHHVVVFAAGRTVPVLVDGDGQRYVRQTEPNGPRPLRLPDGWLREDVTVEHDWVIDLPCPTVTLWFGAESYQGPVLDPP